MSRQGLGLVVLALAACGGSTAGVATDGGTHEAASGDAAPSNDAAPGTDAAPADAAGEAGYLACMSATGQLDASLKSCQSDSDCVMKQEMTDCCGTMLYVGVNEASAAAFDTCEAAWLAHFPACGCDSGVTKTEDGKSTTPGGDAGAAAVHCTDFTMNGGVCMTYTP